MTDIEPQTAAGKVLWHFTMSLDGFVAGPNHEMDWLAGASHRPGIVEEYAETTGAVLGGRSGWDAYPDPNGIYGGAWNGPLFVLTHHPEDATPTEGVTFLDCEPVLLGQGIRLYDSPGSAPIQLHRVGEGDPTLTVNLRYRPVAPVS